MNNIKTIGLMRAVTTIIRERERERERESAKVAYIFNISVFPTYTLIALFSKLT